MLTFTLQYPGEVARSSADFFTPQVIRAITCRAEAAGFGAVAVSEHPAPSVKWRQNGGHDTLDPIAALSFMAAATQTISLVTNLIVLPFRNPYMAAKALASIDVMSGGRLIVGVGTGYLRSEFAAVGVDFDRRGHMLDESLTALRAIWTNPEHPVRGGISPRSARAGLNRPFRSRIHRSGSAATVRPHDDVSSSTAVDGCR